MIVTKNDYFNFSGIDLENEFMGANTDNPSKVVDIFIKRIEDWCRDYLKFNYFTTDEMIENNLEAFKRGVLYQIDHIRLTGEISLDSERIEKGLSKNAYTVFKMGGLCNTTAIRTGGGLLGNRYKSQ